MKYVIQRIIQFRNPKFQFDRSITTWELLEFTAVQALCFFRGMKLLFRFKNPKGALFGKGVSLYSPSKLKLGKFVRLGRNVEIHALGKRGVQLGDNTGIGAYSKLVVSGSFKDLGIGIKIGNQVGIGEYAYLGGAGGLSIGNDCIIGQYFSCHPENHNYSDTHELIRLQGVNRKGIAIGENCWIGSKVTILDGVSIGSGCVIAAGSVVTKDMPPNAVIGGVPARVLKSRITETNSISLQK